MPSICNDVFHMHRRWNRIRSQLIWIDHLEDAAVRKPQAAVGGSCGWFEVGVSGLNSIQHIEASEAYGGIWLGPPSLHFRIFDLDQPTGGVQPKILSDIGYKPVDAVTGKAIPGGERARFSFSPGDHSKRRCP